MTENEIRTRIENLVGHRSARLDDLLEQLVRIGRSSAIEDVKIDLAEFGEIEAVEIISANY